MRRDENETENLSWAAARGPLCWLSQLGMMPPVPVQSARPRLGDYHPEVKAKARLEFEGSPSIVSSSWTSLTSAFSDRQPLADWHSHFMTLNKVVFWQLRSQSVDSQIFVRISRLVTRWRLDCWQTSLTVRFWSTAHLPPPSWGLSHISTPLISILVLLRSPAKFIVKRNPNLGKFPLLTSSSKKFNVNRNLLDNSKSDLWI